MARIALMILLIFVSPVNAETLRVISLYPGHSENIFALGGSDLLVGISENDDAEFLPDLPRISLRAGAERILALKPDIVVTRSFAERLNPNMYDVLKRAGVRIVSLDPPSWDDFPNYLRTLSEALNLDPDYALQKLEDIRSEIASYAREKSSGRTSPRVFIEATSRELHTCAPDSWAAHLVALAGGENIASSAVPVRTGSAIASWGVERVLQSAESLDVYIIQTGAMNASGIDDFHARSWSKALDGIKLYEIPERYLSRPTIFGLELGGVELVKLFWGE